MSTSKSTLTAADYARLANFRHALRAFMYFSEEACAQVGLTGRQYQALLILRGAPAGVPVTINDLAQQMFLKHNSTVGLVDRLAAEGLLARVPSGVDRRKVELRLTALGARVLALLADRHQAELQRIGPQLEGFFRDLMRQDSVSQRQPRPKPARRSSVRAVAPLNRPRVRPP